MNFIRMNNRFTFFLSVFWLLLLLLDIGFAQSPEAQLLTDRASLVVNLIFLINISYRIYKAFSGKDKMKKYGQLLMGGLSVFVLISQINDLAGITWLGDAAMHRVFLSLFIIILFFEELSNSLFEINVPLHPAGIFVLSFLLIILTGALLLMLPRSTYNGIGFIDALFTSTSAVCVTGLTVVDTAKDFTRLGQTFIIILIQVGGLGILTFTSLFGLMFTNQSSFHNQLMVKDMISATSISNTFSSLIRIIIFTGSIEIIGAVLIYFSCEHQYFSDGFSKVFFCIFHSVSAFCNAGFSTMSNNIYEDTVRNNYALHLIIAFLIILGGIGFLILSSYTNYVRDWILYKYKKMIGEKTRNVVKPIVTLNTKIVVITTGILLLAGTLFFYVSEYNYTLKDHEWYGKWVEAFFLSVTPRTAGFNTVSMVALSYPTIMFTIFLMWVGASPGSTGGGIKTSTFALATINVYHQIIGRSRITVGWKEIPQGSVLKAFSIICLSLVVTGLASLLIGIFDPELSLLQIAFETFSAYSTVGLSLNVTPTLTTASKTVLVVTMILGRVGTLTMMTAIVYSLYRVKTPRHQYPQEEVFIN